MWTYRLLPMSIVYSTVQYSTVEWLEAQSLVMVIVLVL